MNEDVGSIKQELFRNNAKKHYVHELKGELSGLKNYLKLLGLTQYIMVTCEKEEQDMLIRYLNDPTKTVSVSIEVEEKT